MKTIVIAGANGFVGRALIKALLAHEAFHEIKIIALSRTVIESENPERLQWHQCDLFSLKQLEKAVTSADIGIYLVHSMLPTSRLDQGSFSDYDLLLADNFARALTWAGAKRVFYLGGLLPEGEKLSAHLESRKEVESVFIQSSIAFTFLRSGLIIGPGGTSAEILFNLIRRLKFLICPRWSKRLTSICVIEDIIASFIFLLSTGFEKSQNKIFDLTSIKSISYLDLFKKAALALGLRRKFIFFPYNFYFISRRWVSLISGAPISLAYPLLESLEHDMQATPERSLEKIGGPHFSHPALLAPDSMKEKTAFVRFQNPRPQRKTVRSVQRMALPSGMTARQVGEIYMQWLPRFLDPFIKVKINGAWINFCFFHPSICLLKLRFEEHRSNFHRQLFYIEGGLLAADQGGTGRLEFREVLGGQFVLAAIHEFRPRLPWPIYRYSQAIVHLFVMKSFARHLRTLK